MANNVENNLNTVPDYLYRHYKLRPDREVVVFAHTDGSRTVVTFGQLYQKSSTLAKSLITLGVKESDFVAISLRACPEWLYATLGVILAGAIPLSLSFTYTDGSDVVAIMKKLETCSAIVLDPNSDLETWTIFQKLVSDFDKGGQLQSELMPYLKFLICRERPNDDDNFLTIEDMMSWTNTDVALPKLDQDDISALFQTSGSTGQPKPCVHSHKSLIAEARCFAGFLSMSDDDILFNDRQFGWVGGFPWNVISGGKRVTTFGYCDPPNDNVRHLIDVVRREKCNIMMTLPPLLNGLLERKEEVGNNWPLQTLGIGGQPVSKRFSECIGNLCKRFACGYGATEFLVGCCLAVEDPDDFKDYAIGYPYNDTQVKIVDEKGRAIPAYQRGEIYVKCDCLFKGYYNDSGKTKASFTEDGWFRTDDIGYVNEDGLFFCLGRKSEMIVSGGMNVAPTILEAVLRKCPGVASVTCVPVAHDVLYQVICDCVILEDGSDVTEQELRQYCEEAHNDKPRIFTVLPTYYLFLEKFPETYTEKVSRTDLTRLANETFIAQ